MAGPAIPSNYYIQQANGNVFLAWNLSAGATSYPVQRSTDGVTFSSLASPVTNYYLDSTATVGTLYYYKVASSDGVNTSSYTSAQSVIPALTGKMSLGQARLLSLMRSDRVGTQFVTVPEVNAFLNQAYFELYDLLITTYEDYNVADPYEFTTDGTTYRYDLPTDFYKLLGVDLGLSGGNNNFVTVKQFNFIARNRYVYPQLTSSSLGVFNMSYRLMGDKLMFIPTPSGGQTVRLWYIPRLTELLQDTDMIDGVSGWDQYVIIRTAKYILDKEESDTSKLDQELAYLKQRIEETAQNRDAGEPQSISNIRNGSEMFGGTPNGDSPFGGF